MTYRLLGIFAHPDDETFCAGGTLAKYAAGGVEVMVVSATRGDAGQIRDARLATRRTLGDVRDRELRAACEALGVQHVECWDFLDGMLREADPRELRGELVDLFSGFRPDVVLTFGDDGAYGHPDHIAISHATTAAVGQAISDGSHVPGRLYHSHFPRSRLLLSEHLSAWLVDLHERFKGSSDFAHALSLFAEESTTLGYASDFIDVKWFPPGVSILEQGEPASSLYLLLSGEVDVVQEDGSGTRRHLNRMGPGEFFGELGIAHKAPRAATVIAVDSVTCLVLSSGQPTDYAGRGTNARFLSAPGEPGYGTLGSIATTAIDVSGFVTNKVDAIAAHRSQFPIEPGMFPTAMLQEMFATEYFIRVHPPVDPETDLLPHG